MLLLQLFAAARLAGLELHNLPSRLLLFACPLLKEWHFKHGCVCLNVCVYFGATC